MSSWCAKCRGRTCATSSTSACSTPRICWRRSRSPRASGSGTSRCRSWRRSISASTAMPSRCRRRCMPRSWREIDGDAVDPMATAQALARVVATRRKSGAEPLTFGMTFPFSTHNYQLRFWMAAGGVDPDEDVRLVVLPPPYMVDSLANGHVDAFCVGAPWNSVAVDLGVGHILHFVSDILARAAEKVLAVRQQLGGGESGRAGGAGARASRAPPNSSRTPDNRDEVARDAGAPDRIGVDAEVIRRTLDGRLKVSPDGTHARERAAICWSGARARRGPIRCRPPGSTRRWCAGGRRRCGRMRSRPPWRCSGRTSTTPRMGHAGQARRRLRRHRRLRRSGVRSRRHRRPSGGVSRSAAGSPEARPGAILGSLCRPSNF